MWLHNPDLLGGPVVGRNQCAYLHPTFWRSPLCREINMATLTLPLQGHEVGTNQYGYTTLAPAFAGSPHWGRINMAK